MRRHHDNTRERLPPISPSALSPLQAEVASELVAGPRGKLEGPFVPMLRSPEMMRRAQALGAYLRFDAALPARLREWAILLVARHWHQNIEWHIHLPIARQAGLSDHSISVLVDFAESERSLPSDESLIAAIHNELMQQGGISDTLYSQALEMLGENGLVDLIAIFGYYGMLAMIMNVAQTALPGDAVPAFDAPWSVGG